MGKVAVGMKASSFELKNQFGERFTSEEQLGNWLVAFIYTGAQTPRYAAGMLALRDHYDEFIEEGVSVVAISTATEKEHLRFAAQYGIRFQLLSDTKRDVARRFGVSSQYFGLAGGRLALLIDPQGVICHVSEDKGKNMVSEMLSLVKQRNQAGLMLAS